MYYNQSTVRKMYNILLVEDDKNIREMLVEYFSKRDKEIMMLRYGLNNTKEYTQKEVANMLGISQSYISRIEKKVINEISKVIN